MSEFNKTKLGFIINPISGMGGSVGLKGTDGKEILKKALTLGAKPNAFNRAKETLKELNSLKTKLKFITCPRTMGENVLKELNFEHNTISHEIFDDVRDIQDTSQEHTKKAIEVMKDIDDIKLILFVGGDGTARDVLSIMGQEKPCLGIPAGVKIYSAAFAVTPKVASSIIVQFLWDEIPLKEAEVLDIDEEEYRKGHLIAKLFGYLLTPYSPDFFQPSKASTPDSDLNNQERIARRVVENLEENMFYLIGPGTTTKAITDILNQPKSVLGVDLLLNKEIVALDLNEHQILEKIEEKKAKIVVSLIGRQGFLFGRGNLQFTPNVLRKVGTENIIIISTKYKLNNITNQVLKLDTRDGELDEEMRGLYRVITDYEEIKICEVK